MAHGVMTGDTAQRMDRMYRYQRHIYDATRKFYLLGRDGLIERMSLLPGDRVVEIGCGTGRNLIALARRYPGVHLYGIDASAVMLRSAAAHIRRAGFESRIRLAYGLGEQLDARAMFGLERPFDSALISYALSMIPAWPAVVERTTGQLRPGGRLAVVDFWDQRGLPAWLRQGLQSWLALFDVRPQGDMPEFFERLARDRGGSLIRESLFGGYAFRVIYHAPT
jgi:S-adenosylmethionine-diacylgycerolhomoserine-N-methlytransferase